MATAKKTASKKSATKKSAAKKTPAKKTAAKKNAAKKTAAKKSAAKKTAPKKSAAKKTAPKKTAAKKTAGSKGASKKSGSAASAKKQSLVKQKRSTGDGPACWPGFERVPGKPAGTKGSCKPKPNQSKGERKQDSRLKAGSKLSAAGGNKAKANRSK